MALPTAKDVFDLLENYNVEVQISEAWINSKMAGMVVPWVEKKTKLSLTGEGGPVTEYYSGTGESILVLRRRPIIALISISYTNVPADQFYISPLAIQVIAAEGILKAKTNFNEANYSPIFARGRRNLRISYTYGLDNLDNYVDIKHAVVCLTAEKVLGHIASRTGGGNVSVQAFSRQYGDRGKFSSIRNDLARDAISLLREYLTGVTA